MIFNNGVVMVHLNFLGSIIVAASVLLNYGCSLKHKSQLRNNGPASDSKESEPLSTDDNEVKEITEEDSEIISHLSVVNYCDSLNQNFLVGEKKKSIYYQDDRKEFCELEKDQQKDARSVAMLVFENQLKYVTTIEGEKIYRLEQSTLDDYIYSTWNIFLCPDVRYKASQTAGFCTAFLVGDGVLLTAGHCILSEELYGKTKIIFSIPIDENVYQGTTENSANWYVKESQIFDIAEVNKDPAEDTPLDYAYLTTERSTRERKHLPLDHVMISAAKIGQNNRGKGHEFFVLGHPIGLTLKSAPGSLLFSSDYHYVMAVDTFGGNSGSPVFDNNSQKVIGILVAGQQDFYIDYTKSCVDNSIYRYIRINFGERILRMDRILNR